MRHDEVEYFADAYDRLAIPLDDELSAEPYSELEAVRNERHLAAVLHAQVQQFFLGLEAALSKRIAEPVSKGRLLQLGLAVAHEFRLEPDEGSPGLFNMFSFMHRLADYPFDAHYGAAFAVDGSVTLMVGPDLPKLEGAGIEGSTDHDSGDLDRAILIAKECTRLAAELGVYLDWGKPDDCTRHPQNEPNSEGSTQGPDWASLPVDAPHTANTEERPDSETFVTELVSLAAGHFHVWWLGSESAWVAYAIEILAKRSLISAHSEAARARCIARLMTLWALHVEFNANAGEGSSGDWVYEVGEWVDSGVSMEELRLLNSDLELEWDFDDEEYLLDPSEVCRDVIRAHHREVTAALTDELGESVLFASMWATRTDTTYPISDDQFNDIVNTDIDGDKQSGYCWVDAGVPL